MAAEASRVVISNPDGGNPPGPFVVRLLGRFEVSIGGRPVPETIWRQRRAAGVIKLLALEPEHRLHREQLMDLLWPDLDYEAQLNNLRQALHHARRGIEAAGMPPGLALQREGDIVVLAPAGLVWVDVHAFERAVVGAWQARIPSAVQDALDLYGGDLLPDDRYEEWAEQRRTTLRASFLALLGRLGMLHDERGELTEAIGTWQQLVAADPTNEDAHTSLMRLYAGSGQRQHALAQFDQLVAILERELNVEPEPTTRALAEAIRAGQYPEAGRTTSQSVPVIAPTLPAPISQLVGREQEIAEVRQLLMTERLVTLTGPGGIGKTRLAIEIARTVADAFPDGVVFIDLAPVRDPDRVIPAIAEALGVRDDGSQPLAVALRARRLLLVLDNIEQVVTAGPEIALLLERAPSLKALVTSRVRLRLRGEREYPVLPLDVTEDATAASPAVALFIARARDAQPAFAISPANAETIAAICRRLDGLPLAIELAAARCRVLSPRAILDRLERSRTLLTAGASDLPERQQTIGATIEWSYALLEPAEQILFARLSVFVGGWTIEAAEAIVTDATHSNDVLDGLDSLSNKNLITQRTQPDGEIRFGMLETIREFGLERLAAAGEETLIRDRHAAWILRLVEEAEPHLESAEQAGWLERLGHDDDNIDAALAWLHERRHAEQALRLVRPLRIHWFVRGRINDGYERTIAIANLSESAGYPILRADALTAASFLAREAGAYQRAYDATRASLAICHQIHDRKRAADALVNLGFIALNRGQIDDARTLLQRSLTTNRELHNDQGIADSLGFLALTDVQAGDLESAGQRLEQCIAIWDDLNDLQGVGWANTQLGLVRLEQADYLAAWNALMASLTISDRLDFRGDVYIALDSLARLAHIYGESVLAVRLAAAAAAIREETGVRPSPMNQFRTDCLLDTLRTTIGTAAVDEAWSQRGQWSLAAIRQELADSLADAVRNPPTSETTSPR